MVPASGHGLEPITLTTQHPSVLGLGITSSNEVLVYMLTRSVHYQSNPRKGNHARHSVRDRHPSEGHRNFPPRETFRDRPASLKSYIRTGVCRSDPRIRFWAVFHGSLLRKTGGYSSETPCMRPYRTGGTRQLDSADLWRRPGAKIHDRPLAPSYIP